MNTLGNFGEIIIEGIPNGQSPTLSINSDFCTESINLNITEFPNCNVFTGLISEDWNTAGNWSQNIVPNISNSNEGYLYPKLQYPTIIAVK